MLMERLIFLQFLQQLLHHMQYAHLAVLIIEANVLTLVHSILDIAVLQVMTQVLINY